MKTVILCGGMGTRLRDVSEVVPKPLVPVGPQPILWHILKHYAAHGLREFVLCLGYKREAFVDYFLNYNARAAGDLTVELGPKPSVTLHGTPAEDWKVTLADTGLHTQTGGRLRRVAKYLDGRFLLTYGDGVSDVDLRALLAAHERSGKPATVTAVHPAGRFGEITFSPDGGRVASFAEKPQTGQGYINGGFLVMEKEFIERYVDDDTHCVLESHALARCAAEGRLNAYRHDGFWACMDTPRDHQFLNDLWNRGQAPWKTW